LPWTIRVINRSAQGAFIGGLIGLALGFMLGPVGWVVGLTIGVYLGSIIGWGIGYRSEKIKEEEKKEVIEDPKPVPLVPIRKYLTPTKTRTYHKELQQLHTVRPMKKRRDMIVEAEVEPLRKKTIDPQPLDVTDRNLLFAISKNENIDIDIKTSEPHISSPTPQSRRSSIASTGV